MSRNQWSVKHDGWKNILTGLGSKLRDKRMSSKLIYNRKSQFEIEEFYAASKTAEKIVDYPIDEAMRKGITWKFPGVEQKDELAKQWSDYLSSFDFEAKFIQAAKWGRLYGAGFLLLGVNDGRTAEEPVDLNNIKEIKWVQALHRWDVHVSSYGADVATPYFRQPEIYYLNVAGAQLEEQSNIKIHASRLIRFDGAHLPDLLYRANNYFHDSVLNKLTELITDYEAGYSNVGALLNDFAQGVFKIKNLTQMLANGKDDLVQKRLELVDTQRSVIRGIILDLEEEFKREGTPLTGVPEVLDRMGQRLVAASEMPHTVLLGEGAAGSLSGQGDSEDTNWSNFISTLQNTRLIPAALKASQLLMLAKAGPTQGKIPQGFEVDFPAMHEMTDIETADLHLKQAQADQIYIVNQVVTPEEIAASRFGSQYSLDTNVDMETRAELDLPSEEEIDETGTKPVESDVQKTALNGAQVKSLLDTVLAFKSGQIDRESGRAVIMQAFQITAQEADTVLGGDEKLIPEPVAAPIQENRADTVEKTGSTWAIKSKKGEVLEKGFKSKKAAEERLKEIEAFKHME